jgi:hypothetical protein
MNEWQKALKDLSALRVPPKVSGDALLLRMKLLEVESSMEQ